uniref:UDENN domain-containing protein n=1 Tax=Palpitomonas bilix TaxID=652834 RepID=A0A7S3GF17_9EUKA|mmetsp:Transcript_46503/g.120013  ORF Transcript_46503/g.120013 Transcript_46503/m.120013 type:complete len:638 (+) Transcript_46503:81-1994(+)
MGDGLVQFVTICGRLQRETRQNRGRSGRRLTVAKNLTREIETTRTGILEAYPSKEVCPHEELLEGFAFPSGFSSLPLSSCPPHRRSRHCATLTNEEGTKLYLAVVVSYHIVGDGSRKYEEDALAEPVALVLGSTKPLFSYLSHLAVTITDACLLGNPAVLPLERAVQWAVHSIPLPLTKDSTVSTCFNKQREWFRGNASTSLPPMDVNPGILLYSLGIDSLLALMCCFMSETKILFVSSSLSAIAPAIEAFVCLMYPFRWPHLYVPLLPHTMADVIAAPVPYILGVHKELLVEQPEDTVLVDLDIGNISVQTDVTPAPKVELNTLKETLLHVTRSPKAILQRQRKWTDKQRSSFFARKTINLGSKRGRSASLDDVGRARSKAQTPDLSHLGMELTDTATATVRTACGYAFWSICSPVMKAAEAGEGKATDVHARDADGKEWHISTAVLDSLDGERKPFFQVFKQSQIFVELLDRHVSRDESLVEFENIGETYPALVKTVEGSKAQEQQQSRKRGGLSRFLRSDSKREVPTDLLLAAMGSDRRARGLASSCAGAELSGREVTFYCRDPSQEGLSGAVTTPFFARKSFASELLEARDGVDPFPESLLQPTDESASAADLHLFIINLDTGEKVPLTVDEE